MKLLATASLLIIAASSLGYFIWHKPEFKDIKPECFTLNNKQANEKLEQTRLSGKASLLRKYLEKHSFNTDYCFLVDMRLQSGKKRFFVYNLRKDSIEKTGLVAHGSGSDRNDSLVFSNVIGSGCTSLGRYKIGRPYQGRFGTSYKLYGLDSSNSNAYKRFVVLHPYWMVPAEEVAPTEICRSLGCPMVSPGFLPQLQYYIDQSQKPILLWIFY